MGREEKVNPNSEWYKKGHPEVKTEIKQELPVKKKSFWGRLLEWILRLK